MNMKLERTIRHPLHRHLGVTSIESEEGCGKMSVTIGENALNPGGRLHGGVIYLLCDVCAYGGLASLMDDETDAVTHDIQVSVMRSVKPGETVDFRSNVLKMGKRVCFIEVRATVGESLVAAATVTKSFLEIGV